MFTDAALSLLGRYHDPRSARRGESTDLLVAACPDQAQTRTWPTNPNRPRPLPLAVTGRAAQPGPSLPDDRQQAVRANDHGRRPTYDTVAATVTRIHERQWKPPPQANPPDRQPGSGRTGGSRRPPHPTACAGDHQGPLQLQTRTWVAGDGPLHSPTVASLWPVADRSGQIPASQVIGCA